MKCKRLLLMLLVALMAPWAAMAQETLTVCDGTTTSSYAPIKSSGGSQTEFIYPASMLEDMEGGTITSVKFFSSSTTTTSYSNTVTVFVEEVASSTVSSSAWQNSQSSTSKVYEGTTLSVTGGELVIMFNTPYAYNGGNLCFNIWSASNTPTVNYYYLATTNSCGYDYFITPPVNYPYATGSYLPKAEFTYTAGEPDCCPKPKNLTCTAYTANTATFTWTNGGDETQWQMEYSTTSDFTGAATQTINQSDLVNGAYTLSGLTAEQTYYARIKAYCPSCEDQYSEPSNTCEFKPTAVVTTCEDFEGVTGTSYSTEGSMPEGWFSYTTATGSYIVAPHVCSGSSYNYYNSGSQSLVFESGTNANSNNAYAVMPANTTGEYSSLTFYTRHENTSYGTLQVGYVTAQTEAACGDFVSLTSITPSTTLHQETIDITSVPSDAFIAFKWQVTNSTYYACGIDDVCIGILPSSTPKPTHLTVIDITSSSAQLQWQAPSSATPTGYQYQYKADGGEWSSLTHTTDLSVTLQQLEAGTHYTFKVQATYSEGESEFVETDFTTLDACAFPTNLAVTLTYGDGTVADFSWTKGYDEEAWILELATDADFNTITNTFTTGFTAEGNQVSYHATGLIAETIYYARVQADCGGGSTSVWSNVETFTPSNYVDYTFRETASSTTSYVPFYGYYTTSATNQSQFVIPAAELTEIAGGTIRSITYYTSSTATTNWGGVTFDVYMAEVENTTFSTATFIDWTTLTNVYTGTVSLSNGMMTIAFDRNYTYNGGNLLIGFKTNTAGTASQSISWTAYYGSAYNEVHQYSTNSANRSYYQPKITFNYQPTPYKYPVIDEDNCTFETTSAHIAWTVTGATPTSYQYQYKPASATEWPTTWTSATTTYADLSGLTSGSFYDFRVKALYDDGNESVVVDYSFFTGCAAITTFPWSENFEAYNAGNFSHPCWVNEHISGEGTSIFKVYTSTTGSNTTHQLQLPDQDEGTLTKLRLPEMNLPNNNYQFVIDVYRSNSTYAVDLNPYEGIRVYASTDGNIDGATQLAFIPRQYDEENGSIPAEDESGWYTYELPIGIQGTCFIILRGESQYCTSTYMDNLGVEEIPTCARPEGLAYSDVTNHSATIEWTAGDAEQTLWQIAYSKTNFDPNTANFDVTTVTTIDATAHTFTLDMILDAESTYYVYVRANCGTTAEPDFGPWNRKGINFTTLAATPAPSNFVASNPASAKVDLVWNAGGGDFESWELYYVASETAPTAPTATTTATVSNITTLPTTEAPYVLEGLNPVTKYFAWIRAKHVWNNETTYSDWVALTSSYFETLDACPTPTDLVATNLTSVSADLSWVGSDDVIEGYTVEYGEEGTYSMNETEDFSEQTPAGYNNAGELPEGWYSYNTNTNGYLPHVCNSYSYGNIVSSLGSDNFLIMTTNASNSYAYAIMPQVSDLASLQFKYEYENTSYGTLTVGYVTDNTGYSTYVPLQTPSKTGSVPKTFSLPASDIATINNAHGYITFRYESGSSSFYSIGIDEVTIKGGTYTPGATQTVPSEGTSITIDGLTPDKTYTVKVKSNCTSGEYCEPISFTTLAEGNKVFTNAANDGKWGNDNNWMPTGAPAITENAILRANATIESGCEAEAKKITFEGTPTRTLTIADGGQLKTDNSVIATVKKTISAYTEYTGEYNGGYCLISTPINTTNGSASTYGMITDNLGSNATPTTSTYDLYNWSTSSSATYDEWRNYRTNSFYIANGTGYLYASKNGVELTFTGTVKANNTDVSKTPSYTTSGTFEFNGWNLYANPFVCDAYINDVNENGSETPMAFYRMNEQGDGYQAATGAIHPMEGIFVQATKTGQSFKFTRTAPVSNPGQGNLNINLAQVVTTRNEQPATDNAIIRFGSNSTLEKFSFRENSSKIFIPMEGKDYAVVSAEQTGEIPVNFKAEKNGTYSLSFTSEEVSFSYLHLIDNMTGTDVDLLANPTYSFDARTTDYESRFRLVFATGSSVDGDSFGFINGMGNLTIFGIEGEATLQVIDVTGRMLSSETFSGSYEKRLNAAPGVYMLRLIQGNDVKVQKMVVR